MITYKDKNYVCLLDLGFEIIRGKWKSVIICHLAKGPMRFLELQRVTSGVSQKVLTEKLKELETDGIIEKIIYPEVPPKVEYILTPKGKDLSEAIELIEKWSIKYYKDEI
ncbi:helix-turn-helix domain-containing protein [uncultured Clostridium sp.]|uniref:winged helix-turn-helix transcriptional regulator n=1 Tax=uncultured Clostridium sp. TaxID=59620 RepID=UPI002602CAD3|nr:helix-turn-helix domain-containing protein [uncultured Clostridium sp.]